MIQTQDQLHSYHDKLLIIPKFKLLSNDIFNHLIIIITSGFYFEDSIIEGILRIFFYQYTLLN